MSESLFNKVGLQIYYKKTPTQVFSCQFCEIFKKNFFTEQLQKTAPEYELIWTSLSKKWKLYSDNHSNKTLSHTSYYEHVHLHFYQ